MLVESVTVGHDGGRVGLPGDVCESRGCDGGNILQDSNSGVGRDLLKRAKSVAVCSC